MVYWKNYDMCKIMLYLHVYAIKIYILCFERISNFDFQAEFYMTKIKVMGSFLFHKVHDILLMTGFWKAWIWFPNSSVFNECKMLNDTFSWFQFIFPYLMHNEKKGLSKWATCIYHKSYRTNCVHTVRKLPLLESEVF